MQTGILVQFNIEKGEGERCTVVEKSVRRILSLIVAHVWEF